VAANYSATIQLIVEGQQKLDRLQNQVAALNKQIKELARLDIGGMFEDPLMGGAVAKLRAVRNEQAAASKQAGQQQDALNRKLENQLLNQIRLNSAIDLYKRRLNEVSRTAAPGQAQFKGRLEELEQAFQFFKGKGSVPGVQATATELGRIVEYSREVTRLELGRVKSSQQIKDYNAQIQKYKAAGLDTTKAEAVLDKFAINAGTNKYALAEKYKVALDSRLLALKEELKVQQRITAEETKRQGEAVRGRNQRIQNIALGGGFPLLFGGGPGAVLGGAAGGLVGGPGAFAAQIGLSAIGQQLDMFVASTAKAGVAFTSTSKALTFLGENALFSSDAAAAHAAELEKQGKAAELAQFLTGELAKVIGNDGVEAMRNLGGETTALNKEWKALGLQIQAFIAGPLAGLFRAFSGGLKLFTVPNRYAALTKDLSPADLKALKAAEAPLRISKGRAGSDLPIAAMETLLARFEGKRISTRSLPITATDLQTITAPKSKKPSDKAARDAARLAEQRQKQLEVAARLAVSTDTQVKKAAALTEQEKLIADLDQKRMERMVKYETLYKEALSSAEVEYLIMAQLNEVTAEQLNYEKSLLDIALQQSKLLNQTDPLANLQEELNLLDAKLRGKEEEYIRQQAIDRLEKQNVPLKDAIAHVDAQIALNKALSQQNALLQMQTDLFNNIASNVASAFSSALTTAIQGTEDLGAALNNIGAQLLGTIGNMLIMYGIAQALGAAGGGVNNPQGIFSFLAKGFGFGQAAEGAYWQGGFQAFADGGMVTRPTMGLVGEGGEAEYIIPASKMRGAMARYASGARGSAVIPSGGDAGGDMNGVAVSTGGAIDVRYTVERINSVDYVTADQFQRGMAQAASQGASQGEQRALKALQNNRSTRSRLGLR